MWSNSSNREQSHANVIVTTVRLKVGSPLPCCPREYQDRTLQCQLIKGLVPGLANFCVSPPVHIQFYVTPALLETTLRICMVTEQKSSSVHEHAVGYVHKYYWCFGVARNSVVIKHGMQRRIHNYPGGRLERFPS